MRQVTVAEAVERLAGARMVRRPVRKTNKPTAANRKKFMKTRDHKDIKRDEKLRALAYERRKQGLPPTVPLPWKGYTYERWGLQVRSDRFPSWGTIAARSIGEGTSELEKMRTGWIVNAYFGYDAQYRIVKEGGVIGDMTY